MSIRDRIEANEHVNVEALTAFNNMVSSLEQAIKYGEETVEWFGKYPFNRREKRCKNKAKYFTVAVRQMVQSVLKDDA